METQILRTSDADDARPLYERVCAILEEGRARVARSVNSEMVRAYWLIGEAIVQHEQSGQERADYGARQLDLLAARLKADQLKGFSVRNLYWMREFYAKFPILHALRAELSWTHYRLLLKVEKDAARAFYEAETASQFWSTRELERQISSLFYERTLLAGDKRAALDAGRENSEKYAPADFIKDPFVLEFLNLKDAPTAFRVRTGKRAPRTFAGVSA